MTVRDRLHLGAVAPEQERAVLVVAQLPPQLGDLRHEAGLLDRALDRRVERDFAEPFGIVGLDDVVGGAEAHRLDDRRRVLAARQHDDLQIRLRGLQRPQRLEPVHARHHHVEQHDVGRIALLDGGEHLVAARVRARLVAAQRQERPQVVGERRIVVDDGDEWLLQRADSASGKRDDDRAAREPASSPSAAGDQMRPPWRSMTRRAIGSASPRPPRFSSNGAGARSYAVCTFVFAATTTTAACTPSVSTAGGRRRPSPGRLFAQNRSEKRVERAPESRAGRRRIGAAGCSPRTSQTNVAIVRLMHMLGHIRDEREEVERLRA